jgi:hypothetical protein
MRIIENLKDIGLEANVELFMRERGKLVATRRGHNVFTVTGRNLLSKLIAWSAVAGMDVPFTHRRARWIGVGIGTQLEVATVSALSQPVIVSSPGVYLAALQSAEFPTATSVRFIKEFGTSEITVGGLPITITEAGLFADVSPGASGATEDQAWTPGGTTLDPTSGTNPPICYKTFEGLTKTGDFTLEIRWEFRF